MDTMEAKNSDYYQPAAGLTLIFGLWLLLSGTVLAGGTPRAIASAAISGSVIAALGAYRYFKKPEATWLGWLHAVLGLWVAAAPWVLGFSMHLGYRTDHLLVGVAVFAVGLWEALHRASRQPSLRPVHRVDV
jgi:hypothetical protein